MPWSKARPRSRKYGHAHAVEREQHMAALRAAGSGLCAEVVCVYPSRHITPAMKLHLCHDRSTGRVRGLGHARCNTSEAARYARSLQSASPLRW